MDLNEISYTALSSYYFCRHTCYHRTLPWCNDDVCKARW